MKTETRIVVLTPDARGGSFRRVGGSAPRTPADLVETYVRLRRTRRPHLWVSRSARAFAPLAAVPPERAGEQRLLLLDDGVQPAQREFLGAFFRSVLTPGPARLLPDDELAEVLDGYRDDLFVGGIADTADRVLVLYRGTLDRLIVPFTWFPARERGPLPDFDDFEVTDCGQTVRLGAYEASADALLYDLDVEYRRRAKARALARDDRFGAALRRLRLQRGVSREDFPGVAAKTVARIERGEVDSPRGRTLERIARRLGVEPGEIGTF